MYKRVLSLLVLTSSLLVTASCQLFEPVTNINLSNKVVGNDDLRHVPPSVEVLRLDYTQVTDAGLEYLLRLPALKDLSLNFCSISDEGCKTLGQMTQLKRLDLIGTQVTNEGVGYLPRGLLSLQVGFRTTDQVIQQLGRFPGLKRFNPLGPKITAAGMKEIRQIVPASAEDEG